MTPPNFFDLPTVSAERAQAGKLYKEFIRVPLLSVGVYVLPAGATDPQRPHREDEVYYVVRGRGHMRVGSEEQEVKAGSVVFVAAEVEHRFFDISEELEVLVFFCAGRGVAVAIAFGLTHSALSVAPLVSEMLQRILLSCLSSAPLSVLPAIGTTVSRLDTCRRIRTTASRQRHFPTNKDDSVSAEHFRVNVSLHKAQYSKSASRNFRLGVKSKLGQIPFSGFA